MNKQSIIIGKIFGIPIGLDYSWFIVFVLFTWSFATNYYPSQIKNLPMIGYWGMGAITALIFFVSVLLHELGHSWVSLRYKIPVKDITLFIFGGISQISDEPKSALSQFWITIVGPLVSLILAGIFFLLSLLVSGSVALLALFKYMATINLILGAFNLIPGYPLDGGGVLMSIVWGITHNRHKAIIFASIVGNVFAYLFIFFGVFQIFNGNLANGLWIAFIGWFLLNASGKQIQLERLKGILSGHHASEAMNQKYTVVQYDTTLQYLVDNHILGGSRRSFIVEKSGKVIGLLSLHHLKDIPREQYPVTSAEQAMLPLDQLKKITPETELWDAIEEMDQDGVNQLPVISSNNIQGMLTREDVISYLRKIQNSNN